MCLDTDGTEFVRVTNQYLVLLQAHAMRKPMPYTAWMARTCTQGRTQYYWKKNFNEIITNDNLLSSQLHRLVPCHHQRDFLQQQIGPIAKHYADRESKLQGSIGSLPLVIREPSLEEREEREQDSEGMEDTQRKWPTESIKQVSCGLQRLKWQKWGLHRSAPGPPRIFYGYQLGVFCENRYFSDLFASSQSSLPPFGFPCPASIGGLLLFLFYLVLSCLLFLGLFFSEDKMDGEWIWDRSWEE